MENRKKWHLFLILSVIILTIYNIFPTVFYYSKPLKKPLSEQMGKKIAIDIADRVNKLEEDSIEWAQAFCNLLQIKPASITFDPKTPQWFTINCIKEEDAALCKKYISRAGSLIPFAPAQIEVVDQNGEERSKAVVVKRKIPIHLQEDMFIFADKHTEAYQKILLERVSQIGSILTGPSEPALLITAIQQQGASSVPIEWTQALADHINSLENIPKETPLYRRLANYLTQGCALDATTAAQSCLTALEHAHKELISKTTDKNQLLLEAKKASLANALKILKADPSLIRLGLETPKEEEINKLLSVAGSYPVGAYSPYFSSLSIDWDQQQIAIALHPDLQIKENSPDIGPAVPREKNQEVSLASSIDSIKHMLLHEIAKIAHLTGESLNQATNGYTIAFHQKPNTSSVLLLNLRAVVQQLSDQTVAYLQKHWQPTHPDLTAEHFSIVDFATYKTLPPEKKILCLVIYSPELADTSATAFHRDAMYCFAKGLQQIAQNYEKFPDSDVAKLFKKDLQSLQRLLHQQGFSAHLAPSADLLEGLHSDMIFEQRNSFLPLLAASREEFILRGTNKQPFLELSTQEERILAENKIDTSIHKDLLRWQDEYHAAQVRSDLVTRYSVPKPTKSVLWSNLKLTLRKMLRGDEQKIIRWGLDLSGGKTVHIELRDPSNQPITSEVDIKQGINELYERVNKKGISDVSIRQVGHQIVLDFPGSQALSGAELIRASTMFFHIVNEKFSHPSSFLAQHTHQFLQEVWDEALTMGKTEEKNIQEIAWKHLYGDSPSTPQPYSKAARILLEQGLRLADPNKTTKTGLFDQTFSKIALYRGSDPSEWHGQSHPLLIVFNNYALEGAHLQHIRASYDPSHGNFLSFEVQKTASTREGVQKNPCKELQAWTSIFSKPKVNGTDLATYSKGQGWRMAAILNDSVIACPTLNESLQDSAMISGNFSQMEVSQLASDLQAGSLSYTPHILSETNVSPELGKADRAKGIIATCIALLLVVGSMILYYRFAGLIASLAVLFNLLLMWAILQNLGATLSLAGIAGLILTVGMAVDANVLVFERIKEEFAHSGQIRSAIAIGYKKAFSAILDSNVTTIIAALILLNFDAGPIKAFAITLIIGVASSMFTALFMTRFYFSYWTQNPKNTSLSMANWIKGSRFPFLTWAKAAFFTAALIITLGGTLVVVKKSSLIGMDFTGGFTMNAEIVPDSQGSYALRAKQALLSQGLAIQDIQVRELTPNNHLRLLLSSNLDQPGHFFASLPEHDSGTIQYPYQKNNKIDWIVGSLQKSGLQLTPSSLSQLHTQWTNMSGQMSDSMRNQAIIGLLIAFAAIFFYITFRFEYKFAIAAIVCLLHDVLITVSFMGILHFFNVPVQIDLHTVAALMTIIGYSLNDTIIIFDRIREDMRLTPQKPLPSLVNHALNTTLSRTGITSGTTLLVLLALVCLGGPSIFSFSLVMLIGVFFGTLSSWFIASPLMLYFHKKEMIPSKITSV